MRLTKSERAAQVDTLRDDLAKMRERFRGSLAHLSIADRQAIIRQPSIAS